MDCKRFVEFVTKKPVIKKKRLDDDDEASEDDEESDFEDEQNGSKVGSATYRKTGSNPRTGASGSGSYQARSRNSDARTGMSISDISDDERVFLAQSAIHRITAQIWKQIRNAHKDKIQLQTLLEWLQTQPLLSDIDLMKYIEEVIYVWRGELRKAMQAEESQVDPTRKT